MPLFRMMHADDDGSPVGLEPVELGCLDDHGEGTCDGPVELRLPLSESGRAFPRCAAHWNERLDREEESRERYPLSDIPPSDFDPDYAGERWSDDY